jgi:hypothetical protein
MSQAESEGNDGRLPSAAARPVRRAAGVPGLLPGLRNGFVGWDDDIYVYQNPRLRNLTLPSLLGTFTSIHASGNWHPLTELSHAADCAVWGMRPKGHHLTSILLHGLNAGLVVALACALARARRASAERSARASWRESPRACFGGCTRCAWNPRPGCPSARICLCASFYLLGCFATFATPGKGCQRRDQPGPKERRFYLGALAAFRSPC